MNAPTSLQPAPTRRQNRSLAILLLLTLVLRTGVLVVAPHVFQADPDGYRLLAKNLMEQGTFGYGNGPAAFRPPLYPLLLTPCMALGDYSVLGIGLLHVLLGMATVAVVVDLARSWGLRKYSLLAGALVAIDPVLLWQSTLVMTETLAVYLAVLALWALTAAAQPSYRHRIVRVCLAGGTAGLAALCRPTFLPWMALCAVILPWFVAGWKERAKTFVVYCAAGAAVLAPWIIRNQIYFGHFIPGTTHGGYTLLLGNNKWFYDYLRNGASGTIWDANQLDHWWTTMASRATPEDEIRSDRLAYQVARETIRRQPAMFAYSCAVHAGRLWSPLPHRTDTHEGTTTHWARYAIGIGYTAEFVLALVGLVTVFCRSQWRAYEVGIPMEGAPDLSAISWLSTWGWGLLLVAIFTAVHTVFWSNIRMRAPLVPIVAMAAAAGAAQLWGKASRRKYFSERMLRRPPSSGTRLDS